MRPRLSRRCCQTDSALFSGRCLRDANSISCTSCLDTNTLCDLPGMLPFHRQVKASSAHRDLPAHEPSDDRSPSTQLPGQSPLQQDPQKLRLLDVHLHPLAHDPSRRLSLVHPNSAPVVPLTEVQDKFKLPKASIPPPPPDAPAFREGGSPLQTSAPRALAEHSSKHFPRSLDATTPTPDEPADGKSTRISQERRPSFKNHLSIIHAQPMQRSVSDPCLLPPLRSIQSQFSIGTASVAGSDGKRRTSQFLPSDPPYSQNSDIPIPQGASYFGPGPSGQVAGEAGALQELDWALNKPQVNGTGLSTDTSLRPETRKRLHSASPEDPPFPEDDRGTSAKRPRKTIGPWTPRRPQTACDSCRTKK